MDKLLAGAGKSEILFPKEILPLEGFCEIHDNPHVRIVYIEKEIRFAIVAMEMVMLPDDLLIECKKMVAEKLHTVPEYVWIHVTHAITTPHSPGGPLIGPGGEVRPIPEEWKGKIEIDIPRILEQREMYFASIKNAVSDACDSVLDSITDAQIHVTKGFCDINENRDVETPFGWWIGRHGKGYSNKEMTVVRFDDLQGAPIGSLVSYGIKPCVIDNAWMREGKRQISADVTGVACKQVELELGMPVVFLMSAAGDQIPNKTVLWDEVTEDGKVIPQDLGVELGLSYVDELGKEMADAIVEIANKEEADEVSAEISCSMENFVCQGKARSKMEPCKETEYVPEREKHVPVGVLKIGSNLAFVSTKPEMNAVSEKELQEKSPVKNTLLVTMVDGGMKYMPDQESFDKVTWEALNSMVMPGAAEKFIEVAVDVLSK